MINFNLFIFISYHYLFIFKFIWLIYLNLFILVNWNRNNNAHKNIIADIASIRSLQKDLKDITNSTSDDVTCPEVHTARIKKKKNHANAVTEMKKFVNSLRLCHLSYLCRKLQFFFLYSKLYIYCFSYSLVIDKIILNALYDLWLLFSFNDISILHLSASLFIFMI